MAGRMTGLSRDFSIDLWHGSLTDQKRSGRCWIYASLNALRQRTAERCGIEDIQFSTNYVYYYDQLEKSKAFLDRMILLRDVPLAGQEVSDLLRQPISSVGQWCYFAMLAEKYGLVPLSAMPDTSACADGTKLTFMLIGRLRAAAQEMRTSKNVAETKEKTLTDIAALLQESLGTPPDQFLWNGAECTPLRFLQSFCGVNFQDYVTLIHHPSDRWPVNRAYHEELEPDKRNSCLTLLSVDMETMKALALRQLQGGEQVVIGCDVRHSGSRAAGELSVEAYGAPVLSKADAIRYREINACHVMSLDGVEPGEDRWRVLDSHGLETGPDGHYVMTGRWFEEYVLSAVIKKEYLPPALREVLAKPAVYMPKTERF